MSYFRGWVALARPHMAAAPLAGPKWDPGRFGGCLGSPWSIHRRACPCLGTRV